MIQAQASTQNQALLDIRGLHKQYGQLEVLKGVDLTMQRGNVVTLIGSSGSGKTTLLRCVNMLEEFQSGQILLDGESIGYDEVNGKRVRVRPGARPKVRVDLRGRPKQRIRVRIDVRLTGGQELSGVREYRTCRSRLSGGRPPRL